MTSRLLTVALLAASSLGARAAAQSQAQRVAEFDEAAARLQAEVALAEQPRRARRVSNAFLRLDRGPARAERLVLGAQATLAAGRPEISLRIATDVEGARGDEALEVVRLRSLAQLGRVREFVQRLPSGGGELSAPSKAALLAEEPRLLPLAADALRGDDRRAGRRVFEALAALRPFRSYRLANLALCLRQIGDVEAAFRAYETGRQRAPGDLELWNDYGLLLRATGRRADALRAFRKSVALDLDRGAAERGKGPAITNLMHMEALAPGEQGEDPVPTATHSLRLRPDATMLRRLMIDVHLDRLAKR